MAATAPFGPETADSMYCVAQFHVKDYSALDLRVPADSPAVKMDCYPRGTVPNVRLGTFPPNLPTQTK